MFYGRQCQFDQLERLLRKQVGSFVTCRGRRRVGKSTLIEKFALDHGARFIKLEGVKPKPTYSNEHELRAFAEQLAVATGAESTTPSNWLNAFIRLDREIRDEGWTVVLLDEIAWFGYYDPMFSDTLRIAWENHWRKHDRLIVVACGSVSSWIKDNIIDNKAFRGRRSLDMVVPELPIAECVKFWGDRVSRIAPTEIIDVLSVTGGVPMYLQEIDPAASADENIRQLAYSPNSVLRVDFDDMFSDVVTEQPLFTGKVLRTLVGGPQTATEISATLGLEKGGRISDALERLAEAGLVAPDAGINPETGAKVRERRYRLRDNYTRYYLKFVEPVKDMIDSGAYRFVSLSHQDGWDTIMGLAFENLVVNNTSELIDHLHLGGSLITSAAPYRKIGSKNRGNGFQIDLLVQTAGSMCLTEIKRQKKIGKEIIAEVDAKVRKISRPEGVSIRTALVYEGELSSVVEANGYFDALVPFSRLMGCHVPVAASPCRSELERTMS